MAMKRRVGRAAGVLIAAIAIAVPAAAAGAEGNHVVLNVPRGDEVPAGYRNAVGDTVIGGKGAEWLDDNAGHFVGGQGSDGTWGNASTGTFVGGPGDDYVVVNDGLFIGGPGIDWVAYNFGTCIGVEIGC